MTSWTFEYDPKNSPELELCLKIDVEIKYINREEFKVYWNAFSDDEDVTAKVLTWDRALIENKAWSPPQVKLDEAFQDWEDSRQPQYNKYEPNFI